MIINELVTNSLKYAFPEEITNRNGISNNEIKISLRPIYNNTIELIVSDNGRSIPSHPNFKDTKSLGLQLVVLLVEDKLHGEIIYGRINGGTNFTITFKD